MRFIFWLNLKGIKPVQEFIDKQSPRDIRKIKRKFKNVADFTLRELYRAGDVDDFKECRKKYGFALYEFIAFEFRFFFVMIDEDIAIACHAFRKKGQKTPPQEINKAIRTAMEVRNKYQLK